MPIWTNSMHDDVGLRTDIHTDNSLYGSANAMNEHAHSASKIYPTLAAGVTVAGGAGAWELGNFVEIVPVNTITSDFDIHFVFFESVSANDTYELVLYKGALASEVEIGRIRSVRNNVTQVPTPSPFHCQIQTANTRISAKLASSGGGDSATISIQYHTY